VNYVGRGLVKRISVMTYPSIFVIVLNWNSWKQTIECLGSIFRNDYPNYRVIVCDNDSQDGSLEYIKAWAKGRSDTVSSANDRLGAPYIPAIDGPVTYEECTWPCVAQGEEAAQGGACLTLIQTGENLGYGGGNNVGLRYAFRSNPTTYALIVNSDVVIPPHFLTKAMNAMLYGPARNTSVVGFPAYFHQNPRRLECAYLRDRFTRGPVHVTVLPEPNEDKLKDAMAHGAALAIAPSAPVKFFPEEYFLYCEDADYCRQVRKRGGSTFIQLDNPVYHRGSKIVGADSPLQIYYTRRSKLTYCRKFNPPIEYSIVLARMLYSTVKGCMKSLVRRDWMAAKAYMLSYWHHLQGKKGRTWIST
jgi:GT2 family glycosyltransferase